MRICKIENCNKSHKAKGYCANHYALLCRNGTPITKQHRMSHTKIYKVWEHIKQRCLNPNCESYKDYGGRGIIICDKWKNDFMAFYNDVGNLPFPKAELDRKENDGNYEPDNCRWVTRAINSRNTRRIILNWFTVKSLRRLYNLHKYSLKDLCKIYNLTFSTVCHIVYNNRWIEGSEGENDVKIN